jgi:hypothetical protein
MQVESKAFTQRLQALADKPVLKDAVSDAQEMVSVTPRHKHKDRPLHTRWSD